MHSRSIFLGPLLACAATSCITSLPPNSHPGPAAASVEGFETELFVWPNGARAAVSLTYDDALRSQLDNAAPALAQHGLVASFFLTGHSEVLNNSAERYRSLVQAGNELGAHTMDHPCDRSLSFAPPGLALQGYDLPRMQAELTENIQQLRDLGQMSPFSFAYPCGSTWLGPEHTSYVPLVERLFIASRGVAGRVIDPSRDTLSAVPSPMGNESGADLIAWVDRALAQGGWVVFTFHGVAGDYLAVQADAHEALLSFLEAHKSSVWTERFGTVASYVKAQRKD